MISYFKNLSGDALVFLAMLIFGSYALFLRFFPAIPAFLFLFSMQIVGAIGFFALVPKNNLIRVFKNNAWLFLGFVAVTLGNDLAYFISFRMTSVANAAFAHQMVSVFLLFLAPIFLAEKTTKKEWVALLMSLGGLFLMYIRGFGFHHPQDMGGITLGLLSALFYALLIVCYRKLKERGLTIREINFWRFSISAVVMAPFVFFLVGSQVSPNNLLVLFLFGLLFAVIASGMHNYAIVKTRSLHVSIIGKSEPVIAAFYALLFLKETPAMSALLGGVLIIGSSIWLAFQKERRLTYGTGPKED
jgi:drug/metabolite transporter (DMT)-like permease